MDERNEKKKYIHINSSTFFGYFKNRLSVNLRKLCDNHSVKLQWIFDSNILEIIGKDDDINKVIDNILNIFKKHACLELKTTKNVNLSIIDTKNLTPIVTDNLNRTDLMYIGMKDDLIRMINELWTNSFLENFTLIMFNNSDFFNLDDDNNYLKSLNFQDNNNDNKNFHDNNFFNYLTENEKYEITEQLKEEEENKNFYYTPSSFKQNENISRKISYQGEFNDDIIQVRRNYIGKSVVY